MFTKKPNINTENSGSKFFEEKNRISEEEGHLRAERAKTFYDFLIPTSKKCRVLYTVEKPRTIEKGMGDCVSVRQALQKTAAENAINPPSYNECLTRLTIFRPKNSYTFSQKTSIFSLKLPACLSRQEAVDIIKEAEDRYNFKK